MKKSRFTETQIVCILKQADAGRCMPSWLDNAAMKELIAKRTVGPEQKLDAVRYLVEVHARPLRQSCECVGLSRAAWCQPPLHWTVLDAEIIVALAELVEHRPSRGFASTGGCSSTMSSVP